MTTEAFDGVRCVKNCRACGSASLPVVMDLGLHAVSDFYDGVPEHELKAPLILVKCAACGLVQLLHSVNKERLYRNYWYKSGMNLAMVQSLKDVTDDAMNRVSLLPGDFVVDIGANDGTLLDHYPRTLTTIGYEPSNVRPVYSRHLMYPDFFPSKLFSPGYPPKIITSIACFYDLDDPDAFVRAIADILHEQGVWINQMMDLTSMIEANAFDNICHEHVTYWDLQRFIDYISTRGLSFIDFSLNNVNGGSLRTVAGHLYPAEKVRNGEHKLHVPQGKNPIESFARRVPRLRHQCVEFLEVAKASGKVVLGYGASTKGNTLLQYYGIDSNLLPAIADRNPGKHGKLTAGSHIKIISEEEMRLVKPDYLLIMPWHFLDGFLEREKDLRAQGTKFVVPLPTFRII